MESGQESQWSHGGIRAGITVESRRSHAEVTVESRMSDGD